MSNTRKRMLWYYTAIIDWMIANPGRPLYECARHVGKSANTLSIIINSDMFKAALAQRKAEFQQQHDVGIIERTTRVATAGLDAILATIEKRKDKLPLGELTAVTEGALARLGYSAKTAGVTINTGSVTNNNVVLPVSAADLAEARMALRQVQSNQARLPAPVTAPTELRESEVLEAELITTDCEETGNDPIPSRG